MLHYLVQMHSGRQYEPLPNARFAALEAAIAYMLKLKSKGLKDLRVVDSNGRVIAVKG